MHENRFPQNARMVFCIGAQKAGTTWLFDTLRQSQQVHFSRNKELHYFDVIAGKAKQVFDIRVRAVSTLAQRLVPQLGPRNLQNLRQLRDLTDLLAIYTCERGDHSSYLDYLLENYQNQPVICDITPAYAVLDQGIFKEMGQIGSAKFIFILRDPIDRMWSQIRMAIKTENPEDQTFQDACIARANRLIESGRLGNIERADYLGTITQLEAAIPQDRIQYLFYETLFQPTTMNGLCTFLGIDRLPVDPGNRSNLGTPTPLPPDIRAAFRAALAPQYAFIRDRFGTSVPAEWDAGQVRENPGKDRE